MRGLARLVVVGVLGLSAPVAMAAQLNFTDTYVIQPGEDGRATGDFEGFRGGGFSRVDRVDYALSVTHEATLAARNDGDETIEIGADAAPTVKAYFGGSSEAVIDLSFDDFDLSLSLDPGEAAAESSTITLEGLLFIEGPGREFDSYEILFEDLNRLLNGFTGTYASSFSGTLAVTYHYTSFPDVPVSEPAALALFGLGVMGVALRRQGQSCWRSGARPIRLKRR
jgi:hypothetical protein